MFATKKHYITIRCKIYDNHIANSSTRSVMLDGKGRNTVRVYFERKKQVDELIDVLLEMRGELR